MYKDLRIRCTSRCTPIPPSYRAYIFGCNCADTFNYEVIIAPSLVIAWSRIKEFSYENDLDVFWQYISEVDFQVAFSNNVIPKDNVSFPRYPKK